MNSGPADPAARQTYRGEGLSGLDTEGPVLAPLPVLRRWWAEAVADERVYEPAAMSLATVGPTGLPNVRMVLLRDLDADGVTFFTNLTSVKAQELTSGQAAVCLGWHPMFRQVRLRGPVAPVSRAQVQAYWDTRPRGSQLASAASHQSAPLASRAAIERQVAAFTERTGPGEVPLPPTWGGYRLRPVEIECWVGQPNRLHDRIRWQADAGSPSLAVAAGWRWTRLQP